VRKTLENHEGDCHCGRVRFRARVDLDLLTQCNRLREKVVRGSYYGSVRLNIDFPILADPDLEKKINLDDLIGRIYRFDQINEGLALMLAGEVARSVVVFD